MMTVARALCVVVAIALAAPALAVPFTPTAWKRYLLPVLTIPVPLPGAHGSLWISDAWVSYSGVSISVVAPIILGCNFQCPFPLPIEPPLPPRRLEVFPLHETALLVHVRAREAEFFSFELRVRDVSREMDSAGTEIPVVPEEEMSPLPRRLMNIPLSAKFRHTLRVYALPEVANPEVEVRYFKMLEGREFEPVLLRTDRVALRHSLPTPTQVRNGISGLYPSIAEIGNFQSLPELAGIKSIWIEVVPVTEALRIWAFASITNDETQQVTIVTP